MQGSLCFGRLAVYFEMTVGVTRGRHSVAFFDAYRTDDFALRRYDIVCAGLGGYLARCKLIHYCIFLLDIILSKYRGIIRRASQ